MDGWIDGWIDGWVDGWKGGWVGGKMCKCLHLKALVIRKTIKALIIIIFYLLKILD